MRPEPGFTSGPLDRAAPTFIAGHCGMVGSAIHRRLQAEGFTEVLACPPPHPRPDGSPRHLRILRQLPSASGRARGRSRRRHPGQQQPPVDFISENLQIQVNVLDAALHTGVNRLLLLGSSCIYPKFAPQPITEDALLTGPLEPTNDAYAIAKIAGILQIQAVRRQTGCRGSLRCRPTSTVPATTSPRCRATCCPR
jgi:GDP-L-fucose synthase